MEQIENRAEARSDAGTDPPLDINKSLPDQGVHFLKALEHFKSHVTGIVTLATGALVLSAAFLKDIPVTTHNYFWLLKSSWVLFTLSVVAGVLYDYVLTLLSNSRECWGLNICKHKSFLAISNFFLHMFFLLAVLVFLIFVLFSV